jgi:hypothetical protein
VIARPDPIFCVVLWLLPILSCTPWLVAIASVWKHLPKDGSIPLSAGERARERLLTL